MEEFELIDDDYDAIACAKKIARRFLSHPKITPRQIVGLGNALYALEMLPFVTPGSFSEFGIKFRRGTEDAGEMRYIMFEISEDSFEISRGGSVYSKDVGSDTISEPGWLVEVGGFRCAECDIYNIEDIIEEYLNLGAQIAINDESDIDYEDL